MNDAYSLHSYHSGQNLPRTSHSLSPWVPIAGQSKRALAMLSQYRACWQGLDWEEITRLKPMQWLRSTSRPYWICVCL
jgi:hypothetical protein